MNEAFVGRYPAFLPDSPPPLFRRPVPMVEEACEEHTLPSVPLPTAEEDNDQVFLLLLLVLLVMNGASIELILALGYLAM